MAYKYPETLGNKGLSGTLAYIKIALQHSYNK